MKTLFISITVALMLGNTAFAGARSLFRDDIGISNWPFESSTSAKSDAVKRAAMKAAHPANHAQGRSKSRQMDRRLTAR
jgi:hypothetical protein